MKTLRRMTTQATILTLALALFACDQTVPADTDTHQTTTEPSAEGQGTDAPGRDAPERPDPAGGPETESAELLCPTVHYLGADRPALATLVGDTVEVTRLDGAKAVIPIPSAALPGATITYADLLAAPRYGEQLSRLAIHRTWQDSEGAMSMGVTIIDVAGNLLAHFEEAGLTAPDLWIDFHGVVSANTMFGEESQDAFVLTPAGELTWLPNVRLAGPATFTGHEDETPGLIPAIRDLHWGWIDPLTGEFRPTANASSIVSFHSLLENGRIIHVIHGKTALWFYVSGPDGDDMLLLDGPSIPAQPVIVDVSDNGWILLGSTDSDDLWRVKLHGQFMEVEGEVEAVTLTAPEGYAIFADCLGAPIGIDNMGELSVALVRDGVVQLHRHDLLTGAWTPVGLPMKAIGGLFVTRLAGGGAYRLMGWPSDELDCDITWDDSIEALSGHSGHIALPYQDQAYVIEGDLQDVTINAYAACAAIPTETADGAQALELLDLYLGTSTVIEVEAEAVTWIL